MRARLIAVGERMPRWVAEGFGNYAKRLSHDLPLELVEVKPGQRGKGRDLARAMADEAAAMLAAIPRAAHVVLLDGRGEPWSSEQLVAHLAQWRMAGRDPAFLVGGPDGHTREVVKCAAQQWSLGPLTLPHMLARLIVAEQLYRAVTIIKGHPYHRG